MPHPWPSPVVAATRTGQLGARTVLLPSQLQVQVATVTSLHADGALSTQQLAWGAVKAGMAVPNTVLGDKEGRAWGSGKWGGKGTAVG